MHKPFLPLPILVCGSVALVLAAHAIRWRGRQDEVAGIAASFAAVAPSLPIDSPLALRVAGLSEDHFNYLRYAAIPRPLELKVARARRVLLLAADSVVAASQAHLLFERGDLKQRSSVARNGYSLTLYSSGI